MYCLKKYFGIGLVPTIGDKTHEHFVFWRKFRVGFPPPPPIAMLKADGNVIDEVTSMSSSSNQHCIGGGGH